MKVCKWRYEAGNGVVSARECHLRDVEYAGGQGDTVDIPDACGPGTGDMNQELAEPIRTAPGLDLPYELPQLANPKQAYGDKKIPLQLVPPALNISAARALKEGARRYGAYNWRLTRVEAMTYIGAIQRHLAAWQDGEEIDPESTEGKHHLDGLAASLAILLDALALGTLIDNRPPKGPAPELVRTPKESK